MAQINLKGGELAGEEVERGGKGREGRGKKDDDDDDDGGM